MATKINWIIVDFHYPAHVFCPPCFVRFWTVMMTHSEGKLGWWKNLKGVIFVSVCQREVTVPVLFPNQVSKSFSRHTHTHRLRNTRHGSVTVPLLTPLCSLLRLSHQQNKTRKSECLPSSDKQSRFLGSAKLGYLLSRQSFHAGVLQPSVSGWFSHVYGHGGYVVILSHFTVIST